MRICFLLGLMCGVLATGGCGNRDLQLALRPGDVRFLSNESERTIQIVGKEGDAKQRQTARYRLEVQLRSGDVATMKVTVDDMSISMEVPRAWGVGEYPDEDVAVLARGQSFTIDLGTDGKVAGVRGTDEVAEAIAAALLRPGIDLPKARRIASQQFSKESVQELFNNFFAYVPESSVGVGDTWQDTQLHTTGMPFQTRLKYTLKSVEDNVAVVDYTAAIDSYHTKASMGLGMAYTFSGEEHGTLRIEADSGWIVEGEGSITLQSRTDESTTNVSGHDRMSTTREPAAATTSQ